MPKTVSIIITHSLKSLRSLRRQYRENRTEDGQSHDTKKCVQAEAGRGLTYCTHLGENPSETPVPFQNTERREEREDRIKPKNMLKNNNAPAYKPRPGVGGQHDQPAPREEAVFCSGGGGQKQQPHQRALGTVQAPRPPTQRRGKGRRVKGAVRQHQLMG